jgi:opacity protein-like surface antigen
MRVKLLLPAFVLVACSALASAQTDVALSIYGSFTSKTDANGVTISPAASAGGMVAVRHIANPILGFEGTYSFNRANQRYNCGVSCGNISPATLKADAHEVTFDWVPSIKVANLRPFGLLGIGALFNVPQSGQTAFETKTSTDVVYVYGAGLDLGLIPHFGLRFQYRGNLYKQPDVTELFTSIDKFKHTAQPMVGIYLRL